MQKNLILKLIVITLQCLGQTIPFDESQYIVKDVKYDYDLISGKVNQVTYQGDESDQLQHRYEYDGDNRITAVYTSTDAVTWTREAQYDYYAHGPLAMSKLGNNGDIEQCSYVYTLQGWIKGVKGQNFSFALGYNNTDYKAITATSYGGENVGLKETPIAQHTVNGQLTTDNLYNGNISTWATNTPALLVKGVADMCNQYTYDQLNRIKSSTVLNKGNAYQTGYSYDANGNIQTLQRYNGTGQLFDQFSYNYENKGAGYLQNTNKLRSVDDAIANTTLHEEDLEDQNIDNYQYDDIGNLNKDTQEDIDKIEWTVYGKVKAVYRKSGSLKPNLIFEYDASGNCVSKISIKGTDVKKTFYLRDASGKVMSTYTTNGTSPLTLQEQYLYGSSRLGVLEKGVRSYELTDHLGNVRTVISEFKEVKAAYEYYAFGMSLAKYEGRAYRYGFNGKEKDSEGMGGGGSTYDYGMRIYNAQIGKFLSLDPLLKSYPWWSPYHFAGNNPIGSIDIDGMEPPVTWNATENTNHVPDNTQRMQQTIQNGIDSKDSYTAIKAYDAKDALDDANYLISTARFWGYDVSADNLQFYLNGTGGTKIERLDFLEVYSSFNEADKKLNNYILDEVIKGASEVENGKSKTFNVDGYAASLTPLLANDLYYASGTSFIKGSAVATVNKDSDGNISYSVKIYKTWVDTYDWHPGLGTDETYYVTDDQAQNNLLEYGAQNFEMRTYYETNIVSKNVEKNPYTIGHLGTKSGTAVNKNSIAIPNVGDNSQVEKSDCHPDKETTTGYGN